MGTSLVAAPVVSGGRSHTDLLLGASTLAATGSTAVAVTIVTTVGAVAVL